MIYNNCCPILKGRFIISRPFSSTAICPKHAEMYLFQSENLFHLNDLLLQSDQPGRLILPNAFSRFGHVFYLLSFASFLFHSWTVDD
jgi:hypothetical protein